VAFVIASAYYMIDFNINLNVIWPITLILLGVGLLARNSMSGNKHKNDE
jgi:hypothetical protein